jgi:hypothetical protein
LGEKLFTNVWELWKERDFKLIMGTIKRAKFLKSNLSLYPTPFLRDYGGKGMGA